VFAATVYLLEEVAHDADKGAGEGGQQHQQGHGSPERAIGRQAGLKARRNHRHTCRNQREEAKSSGQDVEVAGHDGGPVAILRRSSGGKISCVHQLNSGCSEFTLDGGNGAVKIDGAAGIAENYCLQPKAARIDSRIGNTIVVGETDEEYAVERALMEIASEAGRRDPVVFEEGGVGVDFATEPFAEVEFGAGELKRGVVLRTFTSLNAMVRP